MLLTHIFNIKYYSFSPDSVIKLVSLYKKKHSFTLSDKKINVYEF